MRLLRTLAISGSAAVAAGGLILAMASTATTTVAAHSTNRVPSAHLQAEARQALVKFMHHNIPTMIHAPHVSPVKSSPKYKAEGTYNWAGYAATSKKNAFTGVQASWVQPAVTCTSEDRQVATWVGLDGVTDTTVEQDGTTAWCFEGKTYYYTWYEFYPKGSMEVGGSVKPGDKITATVTRTGDKYKLSVTDKTHTKNSFTHSGTCSSCQNNSIEWIEERPAWSTTGIMPQAQYKTFKMTGVLGGAVKGASITDYELTMFDSTGSYTLSVPSSLKSGSFSTTFKNTY
jgi:hypothetical protein